MTSKTFKIFPKIGSKLLTFWLTCETVIIGELAYSGILPSKLFCLKTYLRETFKLDYEYQTMKLVIITTAQLHSSKPYIQVLCRFKSCLGPARDS